MKKITAIVLSLCMVFSLSCFAENEKKEVDVSNGYNTVMSLISLYGLTDKTEGQLLKRAVLAMSMEDTDMYYKLLDQIAKGIDENSAYYTAEEWKFLNTEFSGQTGGIGIIASVVGEYFEVSSVTEDGPADKAGIVSGDRIIECDGNDLTGKSSNIAVNYIRGEIGTTAVLKVLKTDGSVREVRIVRDLIELPSMSSVIIEEGSIAYLRISSFTERTSDECKAELNSFKDKGIKNLIIDLRNNGGGIMNSALGIASEILEPNEKIITIRGKAEEKETTYSAQGGNYDFNIVLLVNKYTASASEILTAALTENKKAVSVGEKTYGKATVQQLFPLKIGGALRITVEQYLTPEGNFIHGKGIEPDYEVYNERKNYTAEDIEHPTYTQKLRIGTESDDVLKIEKLLDMMNYDVGEPDRIYDEKTKSAVASFQKNAELFPYGVCDITTQGFIVNKVLESTFEEDTQLEYAVKLLKGEK